MSPPGQRPLEHGRLSIRTGHTSPGLTGSTSISLLLVSVPLPHVTEQSLQSPYSVTVQSTGNKWSLSLFEIHHEGYFTWAGVFRARFSLIQRKAILPRRKRRYSQSIPGFCSIPATDRAFAQKNPVSELTDNLKKKR